MISAILHSKPGGEKIFQEYGKTKGLTDSTRRLMVNIIVADMMENHGRIPPSSVRTNYALGIVTLFPFLNDPDSEHGYINQDFTRLFGEVVSGTFMAKWPTFFKPRVIADCKTLPFSEPVEDLLSSAQQESNDYDRKDPYLSSC
uniref:Uncharacterized protein n=1 Tax=Oncorhynchus kisutch TaxID=8019 RepID=A0A8C7GU97_ONCKI